MQRPLSKAALGAPAQRGIATSGFALALLAASGPDLPLSARLLQSIAEPNVAYLLFTVGLLGLLAELASPGVIVPGVVGALTLVLSFAAFAELGVNATALVLLALAGGLFVAELYAQASGIAAVAGLIAFVLGSLLLFAPTSAGQESVRVSPWLIGVNATALAAFFAIVLRALLRARRTPVSSGTEALVGRTGLAVTALSPAGRVAVDGEIWSAVAEDDSIERGEQIQVLAVQGVTLRVIRAVSRADYMDPTRPRDEVLT